MSTYILDLVSYVLLNTNTLNLPSYHFFTWLANIHFLNVPLQHIIIFPHSWTATFFKLTPIFMYTIRHLVCQKRVDFALVLPLTHSVQAKAAETDRLTQFSSQSAVRRASGATPPPPSPRVESGRRGGEDQREAAARRRTRILSAPNQPNPSRAPTRRLRRTFANNWTIRMQFRVTKRTSDAAIFCLTEWLNYYFTKIYLTARGKMIFLLLEQLEQYQMSLVYARWGDDVENKPLEWRVYSGAVFICAPTRFEWILMTWNARSVLMASWAVCCKITIASISCRNRRWYSRLARRSLQQMIFFISLLIIISPIPPRVLIYCLTQLLISY